MAPTRNGGQRAEHSDRPIATAAKGDFELTIDELRGVVRFAAESAQSVLSEFEATAPADSRPREALNAAWAFVDGAPRTNLQRTTAFAAHRAAKSVSTETARLAALACGDAAAAAYLHPIAKPTQVGHILRASACAVLITELKAADESTAGAERVNAFAAGATPLVADVLRRYPAAPRGRSRLSQLVHILDSAIRERHRAD